MNIGTEYVKLPGYDAYGRLSSLRSPSANGIGEDGYLANSDLVSTVAIPSGANNIAVRRTDYEQNRNLITSVENKYDTTTISKYDYVNDATGRRTAREAGVKRYVIKNSESEDKNSYVSFLTGKN